jgi:DNA-binding NtrC family response regulator
MSSKILIAKGCHGILHDFIAESTRRNFEVIVASAESEVLGSLENGVPDLLLVYASADTAPAYVALAKEIRRAYKKLPLVFLAKDSSEELVVAALRAGFNDYFKASVSPAELTNGLERCISDMAGGDRSTEPRSPRRIDASCGLPQSSPMLGESPAMRQIRIGILRLSSSECNVLVTGETGTGKELVAELLHSRSVRKHRPFVRINCAAVPDSLFESELFGYEKGAFTGAHASKAGRLKLADGGSVFLDEIGDMSLYTQAKMLRVLENKEIERLGGTKVVALDVRVIAATNRDLDQLVANGQFRGDLYFRLDVVRIHLPPLRNRKEDIPTLVDYYIRKLNARFACDVEGLSEETLDSLLQYDWPGNIRELKNVLECVFVNVSGRRIEFIDLPERFREKINSAAHRPENDRERLMSALRSTDWNKTRAAQKLHWSRMTLYRKMAKFGLEDKPKHRAATGGAIK